MVLFCYFNSFRTIVMRNDTDFYDSFMQMFMLIRLIRVLKKYMLQLKKMSLDNVT